jgi:hypothetical protein
MKYSSRTLFDYINGAAELYLAFGFRNLTARRFKKSAQPPVIVEPYEMASSEDAYAAFSFERQDEGIGIGQGSVALMKGIKKGTEGPEKGKSKALYS